MAGRLSLPEIAGVAGIAGGQDNNKQNVHCIPLLSRSHYLKSLHDSDVGSQYKLPPTLSCFSPKILPILHVESVWLGGVSMTFAAT